MPSDVRESGETAPGFVREDTLHLAAFWRSGYVFVGVYMPLVIIWLWREGKTVLFRIIAGGKRIDA